LIALGLGVLLGVIHFLGERIKIPAGTRYFRLISFAAGISIGYLFLDLFPRTYNAAEHLRESVFLFLLLGFTIVHLAEKYFYQHAKTKPIQAKLKSIHTITFFAYYFLIGCVLLDLVQSEILEGLLFVIPVALHSGLIGSSLSEIHGQFAPSFPEKLSLSLAAPLGVVFASVLPLTPILHNVVISGISGIMLYVFVREFLPEKENGQPLFFIFGLILFYILMQLIHAIFHYTGNSIIT
jgi:zinc transporter ZupT